MLFIYGSKINGEGTDHADLDPLHLTQICMGDWKKHMEEAVKKVKAISESVNNLLRSPLFTRLSSSP